MQRLVLLVAASIALVSCDGGDAAPPYDPAAFPLVVSLLDAEDGEFDLYFLSLDGQIQPFWDNEKDELYPSWGPGNRLVFNSAEEGASSHRTPLFVADANDPRSPRPLSWEAPGSVPLDGEYAAWSPGGDRVVFAHCMNCGGGYYGHTDLFVADAETGAVTRLTDREGRDEQPTWSPDGRRIAFLSNRDNPEAGFYEHRLYVLDVSSMGVRALTDGGEFMSKPDWGPDGTRIAVLVWPQDRDEAVIWTVDSDTSEAEVYTLALPEGESLMWPVRWSPDGSELLVGTQSRTGPRMTSLYRYRLSDGALTRVFTTEGGIAGWDWNPAAP